MPEIRSLSICDDRIQIVHSTGRLTLSIAPLLLRPAGEGVFNLSLRRLHGGILLAGVSAEHAGQLALSGPNRLKIQAARFSATPDAQVAQLASRSLSEQLALSPPHSSSNTEAEAEP